MSHRVASVEIAPRLLTDEQARAYLGGCNPASLLSPTKIGRMVRWDRDAIDKRLDDMGGLVVLTADNDSDAALAEWKGRHG